MKLTGPQMELLRFLVGNDEKCIQAGVIPELFWSTDGLGGARVSKALERRGLAVLGTCRDGHHGAKATPLGVEAWHAGFS